jgi:hypothetical protein
VIHVIKLAVHAIKSAADVVEPSVHAVKVVHAIPLF